MSYSLKVEGNVGKARLEGVDASFKDLCAVCDNIRHLVVDDAFSLLEMASEGKIPIYYRRHNKRLGHRRELGGRKGRYPKKAAKIVLKVLKAAVASAMQKGVKGELFVLHAAANKKGTYPRLAPKGRRIRSDYEVSRVEIIVAGIEEVELDKGSQEEAKKVEEKKEEKEKKDIKKKQEKKEEKGKEKGKKEKIKKENEGNEEVKA